MKFVFHIIILVIYTASSNSSLIGDGRNNILSFLKEPVDEKRFIPDRNLKFGVKRFENKRSDLKDVEIAKKKTEVTQNLRNHERDQKNGQQNVRDMRKEFKPKIESKYYPKDPVFKVLRRKYDTDTDNSISSSSSLELKDWKDEWRETWIQKKFEAINSTLPRGDEVNMVAARPWGVPCGDPNQHDMPWGTCMLAAECDAEYRIYRGDYFCGRTQFVCCSIQLNNYDMYQGFDASFADSSLSTDSDEKRERDRGSKERKRRRKLRERRRRRQRRQRRKKKIKKNIRKIIKRITKILNRSYRNGTSERKKRTKDLKRFVKKLKKKFKKDRKTVQDIHEMDMVTIDAALQKRLDHLMGMNTNFVRNATFRDIVVNGTISKKNARMLIQMYPDLANMIETRRRGTADDHNDYLQYDVEYGNLYT